MRSARTGILLLAALAMAATGMSGCKKGGKIAELVISPAAIGIAQGTSMQVFAKALFTSGAQYEWTSTAFWSSSDEGVATISNAAGTHGIVTAVDFGTTVITATDVISGITTTALLTVTTPLNLTISPANPRISVGTTYQLTATAALLLSDAITTVTQDVTTFVSWSSSDGGIAAVTSTPGTIGNGLVTAFTSGSTVIGVIDQTNNVSGSATLTVTSAPLLSLAVTPAAAGIPAGSQQQFTATGTYADGTELDITASVTWSSSNTAAAIISNSGASKGVATSVAAGTATITATDPVTRVAGSTTLTVTP